MEKKDFILCLKPGYSEEQAIQICRDNKVVYKKAGPFDGFHAGVQDGISFTTEHTEPLGRKLFWRCMHGVGETFTDKKRNIEYLVVYNYYEQKFIENKSIEIHLLIVVPTTNFN